ncbi:lysophospholipid acyltransferase family protein [Chondromyces apiculatus]|uniref:Phospholipid/glycerol acyltransferase n=1 Tax=Chondromyces apiculatus DSM 436 TaxID=1192034 RepID=A0A017T8A7_9BACT|nr:lysophospholipid acyltransferase family protein [Chondromyces apiculatus]EYF05469.1 phospholipid/glycerol acyltransferase [Chondromyces apiculatus DSM 436]
MSPPYGAKRALLHFLSRRVDPELEAAFAALPNRLNDLGFDMWGFNPAEAARYYPLARSLYDYFRTEIHGVENLPAGRVLLVPNHGGQLPLDGIVIAVACLRHGAPPRLVRPMVERWFPKLPYVNEALARSGAVLGDPVNCINLLEDDQAILVFPEGIAGSGKTIRERYRLKPFGRGFMRLALRTNTPVVPVSVIGSEEAIPSVHNLAPLAKLLHMPYFPVSPFVPLLGPFAYLPLPVKFTVTFGEPMRFDGPWDDEDAAIDDKAAVVQAEVQRMVDDGLRARHSIF